jgi:hypothetical protein
MPSSKFTNPKNGDAIPSDEAFAISMAIKNLETGNFVNAQENYFAAPQHLNSQGTIIGHSHVVVELLDSLDQTTPTSQKVFFFSKYAHVYCFIPCFFAQNLFWKGLNCRRFQ